MKTHSIRLPLTASLLCAALLVAPAALASPGSKADPAERSFKVHKAEKGWKKVGWKRTEKGRHRPFPPRATPASVPEFDGGQMASAAALLGGAFLLLASRRRVPA